MKAIQRFELVSMAARAVAVAGLTAGLYACSGGDGDSAVSVGAKAAACTSGASFTAVTTNIGSLATCEVPAGVTSVQLSVCGAQGGGVNAAVGGSGAIVTRTISVTPGDILGFAIGGVGGTGTNSGAGAGGAVGGGRGGNKGSGNVGGGGGGGWSGVFLNTSSFASVAIAALHPSVQVIAAGGGGATNGKNGAAAGANGSGSPVSQQAKAGGDGVGGAGGAGNSPAGDGAAGTGGTGGDGNVFTLYGAGGGGGGRYGGGGGRFAESGAGGGSWNGAHIASPDTGSCGNGGNGHVTITFSLPAPVLTGVAASTVATPTTVTNTLKATPSQSGTGYYIVVPSGSPAPTAAQVRATSNYGAVTLAASGAGPMVAAGEATFTLAGLLNGTAYDVYLVVENASAVLSSVATTSLTTAKFTQTIDFNGVPSSVVTGGTGTVGATSSSGLTVVFASLTGSICTVSGTTVTGVAAGSCTIAADQAGNASFAAAPQVTRTFPVVAPVNGACGTAAGVATATAPSSNLCAAGAAGGVSPGADAWEWGCAGLNGGSSAACSAPFAAQTISGLASTPASLTFGGAGGVLSASGGGSANPVTFSTTSPACALSGLNNSTVSPVAAGTCTVVANQAGAAGYLAAAPASLDIPVAKATQSITFGAAPSVIVGGTGSVSASGGASGNAVSFSSDTPAICTVSDSTVTGESVGDCIIAANQSGDSNHEAAAKTTQTFPVAATVPDAPTDLVATPGNTQVQISFTVPSDGGATITDLQFSVVEVVGGKGLSGADAKLGVVGAGFVSAGTTASPITVAGLTNGTTYSIKLRAINSAGAGAESSAVSVTPATVPAAPTIDTVTPGDGQLTVAFMAPGDTGGAAIANYAYSTDGGTTFTPFSPPVTTSPQTLTGLTNGTTYSIQLQAVNSQGAGSASSAVSGTPRTVPDAPTALNATAGDGSVTISFTAPASNGGAAITNYEFSIDNGATFTAFSPVDVTSPVTIRGLSNGTTYAIRLRALNAAGAGAVSGTVTATPAPAVVAPTPTPVPTATPAPTATPSPVPTATPAATATPSPVPTATPRPTTTPTPAASATPRPTATPVATSAPTATPRPTATPAPTPDSDGDGDGLLGSIEDRVPDADGSGRGDGNGDGVRDANQSFVASLPALGGGYFTVVSVAERQLASVAAVPVPDGFPAETLAPFSGVTFTLLGVPPGGTETVELYMPFDADINGLLKKNRLTGEWKNISVTVAAIGSTKTVVTFDLEDGGEYDADGLANGVIVDPAFPGFQPVPQATAVPPPPGPQASQVSGSGGGAFDSGLLALLAGLLALRRRASLLRAALATSALFLAAWSPVSTAGELRSRPLYFALTSGGTFSDVNASDLRNALQGVGSDIQVTKWDRSPKQLGLRVGFDLTPALAIELGADDLGGYDFGFRVTEPDRDRLERVIEDRFPAAGYGVSLAGVAKAQLGVWLLRGRAGYFVGLANDIEYTVDGERLTAEARANSWLLGATAEVHLSRSVTMGLDFQALDLNAAVETLGIIFTYRP